MAKRNNPVYDTDFLEGLWCSSSMPAGTYDKITVPVFPTEYGIIRMDLYIKTTSSTGVTTDNYVGSSLAPWSGDTVVFDLTPNVYQITDIPKVYYYDNSGNLIYVAHVKTEARVVQTPPSSCLVTCSATASVSSGTAPVAVTFNGSIAPAQGSACSGTAAYSWNFGDGGTSTLQAPSHTYSTPGTYTWTMTGTLGGSSCSKTNTIIVNPQTVTITGKIASTAYQFVTATPGSYAGGKYTSPPTITLNKLTAPNYGYGANIQKFSIHYGSTGVAGPFYTTSSGTFNVQVPFIPNTTYTLWYDYTTRYAQGLGTSDLANFGNLTTSQIASMGACPPPSAYTSLSWLWSTGGVTYRALMPKLVSTINPNTKYIYLDNLIIRSENPFSSFATGATNPSTIDITPSTNVVSGPWYDSIAVGQYGWVYGTPGIDDSTCQVGQPMLYDWSPPTYPLRFALDSTNTSTCTVSSSFVSAPLATRSGTTCTFTPNVLAPTIIINTI